MLDRNKVSYSTTDLLGLADKVSRSDRSGLKTLIKMSKCVGIKDVPGSSLSIILNRIAVSDLSVSDEDESDQD